MQPPPRKGNYCKFLKNLHTEQLAKLQLKNQHECDLLEDIRQFTIKRSQIERSYSEALLKISSAYLNKKIPNIPDIKIEGSEEKWNMWSVWRTVLEENEKLARARLAAIEIMQQNIADDSKILREYKIQVSKRCINQLNNIQKEVQICVSEVDKTKKQYFDEEHSAHDVRDKARDIEEKLKKKKGSFFQSITSLQKNSARVTSRKEQLEEKSTGARNDYILSLASANAHQNRYFTIDLQTAMTTMENYVYEKVADYLAMMGRTELLTCSATQNSFGKIRDQAQQLTREYNLQCCYLFYPVLKQHIQYDYEKCDDDIVTKITVEHESAAASLAREAKLLAGRIVRHNNLIRDYTRKLQLCQSLRDSGQKVDPNDQNGPDLETKMEEFREQIRKAETEKVKSEACFDCLRAGGINVDEWMQEAETLEVQEITRSTSSLSMRTDISGQGENQSSDSFYDSDNAEPDIQSSKAATMVQDDDDEISQTESVQDSDVDVMLEQQRKQIEQLTVGWEDPTQIDWGTVDAAESTSNASQAGPIFKCTALYSYTAQNPDELTIVENEQLEVVGEGDGDGWLRARNYRGEEGYVPHNYLDVERDQPVDVNASHLTTQISFSSVDYTIDNDEQDGYQDSVQSPDQVSVISAPVKPKTNQLYCIALYDYDATAEDELNFEEGQIIKIITMSAHGVDDGWWEGELDGKTGNFPSLVVEECDENGEPLTEPEEEDESPPPSAHPVFTPPSGLPPIENAGESVFKEFSSENLELDLTSNHQKQPQISQPKVDIKVMEEKANIKKSIKDESASSDFNLGVSQIIIVTAATPCGGEDKHFPAVGDVDKTSKIKKEKEKKNIEQKKEDLIDDVIEEEELSPTNDIVKMCVTDDIEQSEIREHETELLNRGESEPILEEEEEETIADADQNDNIENNENFFEANFDEAFQEDPNVVKVVVGGRASIPDELNVDQLARLQNLKESNA